MPQPSAGECAAAPSRPGARPETDIAATIPARAVARQVQAGGSMKRARFVFMALGAALATLWAAGDSVAAPAGSQTLKQMMGDNFAGLQVILVGLIKADYSQLPPQLKLIEKHAEDLTHNVPKSAEADRDRFESYAYNLETHAKDLESIVQTLEEHDRGKLQLSTDSLREAAAAHYGGMVEMCVTCHNRFRPNVVR
jgi:cytochrome c556